MTKSSPLFKCVSGDRWTAGVRIKLFWSKVNKTEACWLWTGGLNEHGYGIHGDGRAAHRISWMMEHGPIPPGFMVLHKCNVRNCINPDHLYLGNAKDNARDRDEAGHTDRNGILVAQQKWANMTKEEKAFARRNIKYSRGEKHHRAKLTDAQAQEIRARYVPRKVTLQMLADEYGVNNATIHRIISGDGY